MGIKMRFFTGYRGTHERRVRYLFETGVWDVSSSFDEYFGHGIYFFENDPREAYCFARFSRHIHPKEIAVIEVEIAVDNGKVFDLLLSEHHNEYMKLVERIRKEYIESKKKPEIQNPIDCRIINLICDDNDFSLVRGPYNPASNRFRVLYNASFTRIPKVHIQLCVRDKSIIKSSKVYVNKPDNFNLEGINDVIV